MHVSQYNIMSKLIPIRLELQAINRSIYKQQQTASLVSLEAFLMNMQLRIRSRSDRYQLSTDQDQTDCLGLKKSLLNNILDFI